MRNDKRVIKVGNLEIGANNPVIIQSMTTTHTKDLERTVQQIKELSQAGAQIVRLAILDMKDALTISEIKKHVDVPLVADIHFDYRLALEAINQGIDKIRINPGNISKDEELKQIVEACKEHHIPIRIGINSGSIEQEFLDKYHGPTIEAMLESMKKAVKRIEDLDFQDLILSIKATDIESTIKVNEELDKSFSYPLHIGLTEAGTVTSGTIRSSYALGVLLNEGIGNTIRVSLHGNPVNEIPVAKEILSMCHLYNKPTLIVCPTCGRTSYNMTPIVNEIESYLNTLDKPIKVAIMGCVVNGTGEARDADIGLAGGKDSAVLFKHGEIIRKLSENEIISTLKDEIEKL